MLFKIWERYFLRETLKVAFLILFCFYGLFVLIDYASHSSSHSYHHTFQWGELFLYYYCELVLRLDVLLPFALVIACIRTLTQLNINNELMAFMAGGFKLKKLLRPFILIGLVSTAAIYANTEYFLPKALNELRHLNDAHSLQKNKKNKKIFVQHIALKDLSTLLFQEYDAAKKMFFDTYWIRSFDEIYRIKTLYPYAKIPTGQYVDQLVRNDEGMFEKVASFEEKSFPEIRFNKKVLLDTITPPEELSLSRLIKELSEKKGSSDEKHAQIQATLYKKLVIPWLCLIAALGPAPFCVRFSRYFPVFFIYAFSIFGLVACYLVIDAAEVLASRQVLPAGWAIGTPFALLMGGVIWKFTKVE